MYKYRGEVRRRLARAADAPGGPDFLVVQKGEGMAEGKLQEGMAEGKLREGIYLETKKSMIGTGSTAKVAEYRNFWVTLRIREAKVEMILLDDAFSLTGIKETFDHEVVSGANWLYVEQGEKKYQQLKPKLDKILNPPPKGGKPAPATSGEGAASVFNRKPAAPQPPGSKKNGWWSN
jgi:hypothetical protein